MAKTEPPDDFGALWSELDEVREACGWSRERLARQVALLGGQLVSAKTLHDRMLRGRRFPWDQLRLVVLALTLDEAEWRVRWHRAESHRRTSETRPSPAGPRRSGDGLDRPPAPVPVRPGPGSPPIAPAQLIADVPGFIGRRAELAELDRLAEPGLTGSTSAPMRVCTVAGTAGVGKTALAVHWAHRVRDAFPDGQLYVDLRGYDPQRPVPAQEALAGFLSALGTAGPEIPGTVAERAARYRTLTNGRRMLIVLDNASTVEQVRPLLPGAASCVVLVTCRDQLAGLVALHGARRVDLDPLPPVDALDLLRGLIGSRVDAEPEAATRLCTQCCRLPLTLRVAAELAGTRANATLGELATELDDRQRRLELLDAGGDSRAAVHAVFSWSHRHLPDDAARAFRLLGLQPCADLDVAGAAALLDADASEALRLLRLLARAHLVQPSATDRHGMHDLLRAYAARRAVFDDSEGDRRAALARLLDPYLATATAAADALFPADRDGPPSGTEPGGAAPPLTDPDSARRWLDAERPALVALSGYAAANGWPTHVTGLAAATYRYFAGGQVADGVTMQTHALDAAVRDGDRATEALVLTRLGTVRMLAGDYDIALDHLRHAALLCRESGDASGEAQAVRNLGLVHWRLGAYQLAAEHQRQALALFRELADRRGETATLTALGMADWRLGRPDGAAEHQRQALALFRELGDAVGAATALSNLGIVDGDLGRHGSAADCHRQAFEIFRTLGNHYGGARALTNLGVIETHLGRYDAAADSHRQALAIFRGIGDRYGEAGALNGLGEALTGSGRPADATALHTAALAVAARTGHRDEQARAHSGLGHDRHALGDTEEARRHWQCALILHTELGSPHAEEIRAHLDRLDAPARS